MLYDAYAKKMRKVARVRNFVIKYRIPIIITVAVIISLLVAFVSTKGAPTNIDIASTTEVTTDSDGRIVIEYGGEISAESNALFADSRVEYLVDGEWTEEAPQKPGEYSVRVVSTNSFGGERTGKEQKILISQKKVDVTLNDTEIEYGTNPSLDDINIDLVEGDELVDAKFKLVSFNQNDCTKANYVVEEVKIVEKATGRDVTNDFYSFNFIEKEIKLTKTTVDIDIKDLAKVFNDTIITEADYVVKNGNIVDDNSELRLTYDGSIVDSASKDASIRVILSGLDITALYDFNINVNKRNITILSDSIERTYNGTEIGINTCKVVEGELAPNHEIIVLTTSAFVRCGVYANEQTYKIVDKSKNNEDVTAKYNISTNSGIITITPYTFTVAAKSGEAEYDGKPHTSDGVSYEQNEFLDQFKFEIKTIGSITHVGTQEIIIPEDGWKIYKDGIDVSENFVLELLPGTFTITKKALVITVDNKTAIYGSPVSFTVSTDGFAEGEDLSNLTGELVYECLYDVNDSLNRGVGNYEIKATGLQSEDYDISFVNGELTVAPKLVHVSVNNASIIYGDDATNNGISYSEEDFVYSETSAIVNDEALKFAYTYDKASSSTRGAGNYVISASGLTSANYVFEYNNGTLAVNPKTVHVTIKNASIIYGEKETNDGITYSEEDFVYDETSAIVNGEALEFAYTYDRSEASTRHIGDYTISASGLECANYIFEYANGTLTVNPKTIHISANDSTILYGEEESDGGITYTESDFVYGETKEDINEEALVYDYTYNRSEAATRSVGEYVISASGLACEGDYQNYVFDYSATGTLVVTPKPFVITIDNKTITYGDAKPEFTYQLDEFAYIEDTEATAFNGSQVLDSIYENDKDSENRHVIENGYAITATTPYTSSNYDVSYVDATLTVSPKTVRVTVLDASIIYGEAEANNGIAYNEADFVYEETSAIVNETALDYSYTYSRNDALTRGVGEYVISASGLACEGDYQDYVFDYSATGTLVVTPKPFVITINDQEIIYGDEEPTYTYLLDEFAYIEDTEATAFNGPQVLDSIYENDKDSNNRHVKDGGYAITATTPYTSSNYDVSYVDATLTVVAKTVHVTVLDASIIYGEAEANNGITYNEDDFVYEETSAIVNETALDYSYTYSRNEASTRGVGEYVISASGLTCKGEFQDYVFDYTDGTLEVTPKPFVITIDNKVITYGDAKPGFTYQFDESQFAYIEDTEDTAFNGPQVLDSVYENDKDSNNRHVKDGGYAITATTPYTSSNYDVSYVDATLTVNPKTVRVTVLNASIIYGEEEANDGVSYEESDFVYEETSAIVNETALAFEYTYSRNDALTRGVGDYVISASGLACLGEYQDYVFDYTDGTLAVLPKPFTIVIDDKAITYGDAKPAFTYQLDESQFAYAEDNETTAFNGPQVLDSIYENDKDSNNRHVIENGYAITATTPYTSSNYDVSYVDATLMVAAKTVRVTVLDASIIYGQAEANNGITYNEGDFVYEETSAIVNEANIVITSYPEYDQTDANKRKVGSYPIVASGLACLGEYQDYVFDYTDGTLTVNAKTIHVTVNNASIIYGEAEANNGITYKESDFVYGDTSDVVNEENLVITSYPAYDQSDANKRKVGTYPITATGLECANYVFDYTDGTLEVTPKPFVITIDNKVITYGDAKPAFTYQFDESQFAYIEDTEATAFSGPQVLDSIYENDKDSNNRHVIENGYAITATTPYTSSNYDVSYVDATLMVVAKTVRVTVLDASIIYGEAEANNGITYNEGDFVYEETSAIVNAANLVITSHPDYDQEVANKRKVGTYPIVASGLSCLGNYQDYVFDYTDGTLTVNARPITIKTNDMAKLYGFVLTVNELTFADADFVYGETMESLAGSKSLVTDYDISDAQTRKVGSYDISITGLTSTNYAITFVKGTLTINPRPFNIEIEEAETVYGSPAPQPFTAILDNFEFDEDVSVFGGTQVLISTYEAVYNSINRHAGKYPITATSKYTSSNYAINYVNDGEELLTVKKKDLTVKADDKETIYGELAPAWSLSATGFAYSENISSLTCNTQDGNPAYDCSYNTGLEGSREVRDYDIEVSGYISDDYNIDFQKGTLTVNKRPIDITARNYEAPYGLIIDAEGYGYEIEDNFVYDDDESVFTGKIKYSYSYDSRYKETRKVGDYKITPYGYSSDNYEINYVDGTLTITKKDLNIRAEDKKTVYGNAAPEFTIKATGLEFNETVSDLDGSIEYSCSYNVNDDENNIVKNYEIGISGYTSDNYNISFTSGTLEVQKRIIKLFSAGAEKVYDGVALENSNVEIKNDTEYQLLAGHVLEIVSAPTLTDAGTTENRMVLAVKSEDGTKTYTSNYDLESQYVCENLEVTKRKIRITADSAEKDYDGTPLICNSWTVALLNDQGNVIDGEGIVSYDIETVSINPGSITYFVGYDDEGNVRSISNDIVDVTIKSRFDSHDVKANYDIELVSGELKINPTGLIISTGSVTKQYDDEYITCEEYEVVGSLPLGYTYTVTNFPSYKDAETYENKPDVTVYDSEHNVVTGDEYESLGISVVPGTIEITSIVINLPRSKDANKPYDGGTLVAEDYGYVYDNKPDNILSKHLLDAVITGSISYIGTSPNTITARITDLEGNDIYRSDGVTKAYTLKRGNVYDGPKKNNYLIILTEGTLFYSNTYVQFTPYDHSCFDSIVPDYRCWKVYDGEPFELSSDMYYLNNWVNGHTESLPSGSHLIVVPKEGYEFKSAVGEYILETDQYDAYIVDGNDNILDSYIVRGEDITYRIYDQWVLSIYGNDIPYDYNGAPQVMHNEEYVWCGYLAPGHRIVINYHENEAITNVGDSTRSTFDYWIYDEHDNDVTDLYTVETCDGQLSIRQRYIEMKFEMVEHEYDGTAVEINANDLFISAEGLLPGHHITNIVLNYNAVKNCVRDVYGNLDYNLVGIAYITVLDAYDHDVSDLYRHGGQGIGGNYSTNCVAVKIIPLEIVFNVETVEKIYDGTPLTGLASQVSCEGLIDGDELVVLEMTGSQTNVGHSPNDFDFSIINGSYEDVTCNYVVSNKSKIGNLVVKGRVSITLEDVDHLYDGYRVTGAAYLSGENVLVAGYTVKVSLYSQTHILTDVNRNQLNEVIPYTDRIEKVVISNDGDNEFSYVIEIQYDVHDGEYYICYTEEYSLLDKTLHVCKQYDHTGKQVYECVKQYQYYGEEAEYVRDILGANVELCDYDINFDYADITINPLEVVLKSDDKEYEYDGYKHYNTELYVDLDNTTYNLLDGHSIQVENEKSTYVREVMFDEHGYITTRNNDIETRCIHIMDDLSDVTHNYDIVYNPGKLKVNKRQLTIQTHDYVKDFDGISYFEDDDESLYSIIGLAATDSVTYKAFGNEFVNVGDHDMKMILVITNREAHINVTNSYEIKYVYGTLTITGEEFPLGDGSMFGGIGGIGGIGGFSAPEELFTILTTFNGTVYLRGRSYGDYLYGEFTDEVDEYFDKVNPLEYQGISHNGVEEITIDLTSGKYTSYLTTYYSNSGLSIYNDVYVTGSYEDIYTLKVYRGSSSNLTGDLLEYEEMYRDFVNDNYLGLDLNDELNALLEALIYNERFDKNDASIVNKVANYVRTSGKYNVFADNNVFGYDPLYYFLNISNEGTSQEFAASAVLIYRMLGIPARYVTGFRVDNVASGYETSVTNLDGYCWVEVYVDGQGWIYVDPTPYKEIDGEGIEDVGDSGDHIGDGIFDDKFYPQDGDLSTDYSEIEEKVLFTVQATKTGILYLKEESRGDYTGTGFEKVSIPYTSSYCNPMNYPAIAQGINNLETVTIDMRAGLEMPINYRVMPYFIYGLSTDYSDVLVYGDNTNPYSYNYVPNEVNYANYPVLEGDEAAYEEQYRSFVYAMYLSLDGMSNDLKNFYNRIIQTNHLDKNNKNIIEEVARYIQNAAEYSTEFEFPKNCPDMVYYFLSESKKGICQEYAAAATMLFRYLGIPARWTKGFLVNAYADTEVVVTTQDYHAWVEVYLDGFGWVPVEVTGSQKQNPNVINVSFDNQFDYFDGNVFEFDESSYKYRYTFDGEDADLPDGYRVILEMNDSYEFETNIGEYKILPDDYTAYVVDEHGTIDEEYTSYIHKNASSYRILDDNQIAILPYSVICDYDGEYHEPNPNGYELQGRLKQGHTLTVTFYGTRYREIGSYPIKYYVTIKDGNATVNGQYDIILGEATLSIEKAPLKIYFNDIHHEFDGSEVSLSMENVRNVVGLLPGHTLESVSSTTSFSSKMFDEFGNATYGVAYVDAFKVVDGGGNDVSKYYECHTNEEFEYNRCNIYIDSTLLILKPKDVTEFYDGKVHVATEVEVAGGTGSVPPGYSFDAVISGSITEPGKTTSSIESVVIYDSFGNDVTGDYIIKYETGTITVSRHSIRVTAGYNGTYDGESHDAELVVIESDADLNSVDFDYSITGSRTNVGKSDAFVSDFKVIDKESGKDMSSYYSIVIEDGSITIKPYEVTIKPAYSSKFYDGTPLTCSKVEYVTNMDDMLDKGYYIVITTDGSAIYNGVYTNRITSYTVYDNNDVDVTTNFSVTTETGELVIDKYELVLTPRAQTSHVYDGTTKVAKNLFSKETNCEFKITVSLTVVGSRKEAGETTITIDEASIVVKDAQGNIITNQFRITCNTNILRVNKRSITVKPDNVVAVYNGESHEPSNYVITSKYELAEGHEIAAIEYSGSRTNVGSTDSSIVKDSIVIIDENLQDVTSNYDIVLEKGTITVE